ncbi:MAG: N-6 DNA methylase [Desulfovibrio sp.]|nr:N-6 DNA methylase [Desulfovibrio sp.]
MRIAASLRNGKRPFFCAELGTGCGAAILGLALLQSNVCGCGIEIDPALTSAASRNAEHLGLAGRITFLTANIADCGALSDIAGSCSCVIANPPYAFTNEGRPSPHGSREKALREDDAPKLFSRTAHFLLKHHSPFFCIFSANNAARLILALSAARLGVRRILPVAARRGESASRVLVEARRDAADDLRLEAPLVLHPSSFLPPSPSLPRGSEPHGVNWTDEAIRFCPWLCSARDKHSAREAPSCS